MKVVGEGLSYDDVLIVPAKSPVRSRKEVDTESQLTKKLSLKLPMFSANMDTVTEVDMAIAMANQGGIGILHRWCTIEEQAHMVSKVKRIHSYVIENPVTVAPNITVKEIKTMQEDHFGSVLVVNNQKLVGIVTDRDIMFQEDDTLAENIMTKNLVTASLGITTKEAKKILLTNKIEKLPLVDENNHIEGLITLRDILKQESHPNATRDNKGRLKVGASIGIVGDYKERLEALIKAEVDVIDVDIAHAHSEHYINNFKELRKLYPEVDFICGTIATAEAARDLIQAGADILKVGVGAGSICTTRLVAGAGIPQISAIMDVYSIAQQHDIAIIADSGIKLPGDVAKAVGAGAAAVWMGNMLAGTKEAPGRVIVKDNKRFKVYRGSSSIETKMSRNSRAEGKDPHEGLDDYSPEGVQGLVPYKGSVVTVLKYLEGGLRSGMSYAGSATIKQMNQKARFVKISAAGMRESRSHDISQ